MNTPDTECESVEEFAQKLSEKVRYFSGKGQYEENSDEQKAYIDGVETAIGMMYIDLTGTQKTKGMLASRDTYWKERVNRVLVAMSWSEENETSEAIRVLHEVRERLLITNEDNLK